MTESMPKWIERFANGLAHLPRSQKRLLMLVADVVGIPLVLWSAITLRLRDRPVTTIAGTEWIYAAALLTSIPIFVRMGLYRAVIRFLGPKAIFAVISGVTASVVLLAAVTLIWPQRAIPLAALPIYWAFALIYVGGSRFLVRGLLNFRWSNGTQRVVDLRRRRRRRAAGDGLGAQRPLSPGRVHRRQQVAARQHHQRPGSVSAA